MKILWYSPQFLPRLQYLVDNILPAYWGIVLECTTDSDYFTQSTLPKINYSPAPLANPEVFVPMHPLLTEKTICKQDIHVFTHDGLPAFFQQPQPEADFPFDLFALVFYLLSRYEEYLPQEKDQHGRFPAAASVAYKAGFLQQPLVDQWLQRLTTTLVQKFPSLQLSTPTATFLPTYDVDYAWAYQHKGWWRTIGGYAQELLKGRWKNFRERLLVQFGQQQDPFYTFPYLDKLHQTLKIQPLYFFLLGNYGEFDKNISPENPTFRSLIRNLSERYKLGIHPSYQSNTNTQLVEIETNRLATITKQAITKSRQHYLILSFPDTYRRLLEVGIQEDYSLGYSEAIGFRASTAQPFYWYDVEREETTTLRLFPFQLMDVTLKEYLHWTPQQAWEQILPMIDTVAATGGTFITLWHNSSFAESEGWTDWQAFYEQLVKEAKRRLTSNF